MPAEDVIEDGYDLRPDGSVILRVDSQTIRLRVPRIGDIRRRHDAYIAIVEDTRTWLTAGRERLEEEHGADSETMTPALFELLDEAKDRTQRAMVEWWRDTVAGMGDGALPEGYDDLPGFLNVQELPVRVLEHWRALPPPSGVPRQ
jgi:hypothetical protein